MRLLVRSSALSELASSSSSADDVDPPEMVSSTVRVEDDLDAFFDVDLADDSDFTDVGGDLPLPAFPSQEGMALKSLKLL